MIRMERSALWLPVNDMIDRALAGEDLILSEVETIYGLEPDSPEAYLVRWAGNRRAMELSGGIAEIHARSAWMRVPASNPASSAPLPNATIPRGN